MSRWLTVDLWKVHRSLTLRPFCEWLWNTGVLNCHLVLLFPPIFHCHAVSSCHWLSCLFLNQCCPQFHHLVYFYSAVRLWSVYQSSVQVDKTLRTLKTLHETSTWFVKVSLVSQKPFCFLCGVICAPDGWGHRMKDALSHSQPCWLETEMLLSWPRDVTSKVRMLFKLHCILFSVSYIPLRFLKNSIKTLVGKDFKTLLPLSHNNLIYRENSLMPSNLFSFAFTVRQDKCLKHNF